jgi:murein DD-endopeptidase MepM/ murein hydrolase activator NlpD
MRYGTTAVVFAMTLFWAAPGAAQNELTNSDFDTDVSGWTAATEVSLTWSSIDAGLDPGSGSAQVDNQRSNSSDGAGMSQCVASGVVPGADYDYGGKAFIPSGQDRTGPAQVGLRWYADTDCAGYVLGSQPRSSTETEGTWVELGESGVTAPTGAASVLFLAFPTKYEAGGTRTAHFDDLYLRREVIFTDGFESGGTDEWSTTVMAFVTQVPYYDSGDIEYAGRTFCTDGNCPWGPGMHDGIDFVTGTSLVPFRAACDGTVTMVDSFVTGMGNRQVNVLIELSGSSGFGLVYAFEPMTSDPADLQEANIEVQVGSEVSAGDLLGRLVMAPAVGSHVHWGVVANHQQVCPKPHLTTAVESALLALVHEDEPTGKLCY